MSMTLHELLFILIKYYKLMTRCAVLLHALMYGKRVILFSTRACEVVYFVKLNTVTIRHFRGRGVV